MTHAVPHGSPRRGGTPHRGTPRHPYRARLFLLALVSLSLVVTAGFVVLQLGNPEPGAEAADCDDTRVTLSADPRIAPVVEEVTSDLGPWLGPDDCFVVDVVSQASATTAAEITRPEGVGLSAPLPDLWLPDSSVWIQQAGANGVGAQRLGGEPVSVATSPVVLAVPRDQADGWPSRQPTWSGLLAEPEGRRALATTDLDVDAVGLLSLSALTGASTEELLGVTRRLAVPLLGDEPAAGLVVSGEVDAIPSSEQDVIAANVDAPDADRVVAAYDPRIRSSLDFPLATVANEGAGRSGVITRAREVVLAALLDPATQDLLAGAGLRTPEGELAGPFGEQQGVLPDTEPGDRLPSVESVRALSSAWATIGRRSRLLVLVDRSGSMAATLPGSTDTRATLAQSSLRRAIRSIAPDSDVGLWSFTTGLPDGDIEVLVPTGTLASAVTPGGPVRRAALLDAVSGLVPQVSGGTPLYDAVLAGFRDAQGDFAYGRLNALVVITDGRNEDDESVSLPGLLDALRLEFDGVRPVRIIAIGYGGEADTATLRRITDITGGRTYRALTADEVSTAFARVLANL
jgi:hypothetical protein